MKVKLKPTSEDVPLDFLCKLVFGILGFLPENCESVLKEKGFLELELDAESYEKLKQATKRYGFMSVDLVENVGKVRLVVALVGKGVSPNLACSILSGLIGFGLENCKEQFMKGEEVLVEVDEEKAKTILKHQQTYPFFSFRVVYEGVPSVGSSEDDAQLFSNSWQLLKKNVGFFSAYMFLWLFIAVLSAVPILGFFFSILSGLYSYLGILYMAVHYASGQSRRNPLQFSKLWDYFVPALGIYVGGVVLLLVGLIILVALALLFGGLGLISDFAMKDHQEYGEWSGVVSSMLALVLVLVLVFLYYLYTLPLVYARTVLEGLDFKAGFMAAFFPFTPKGFQDAFSNKYFKLAMYLWLVLTVGVTLAVLAFVTIVFIPVALAILAWLLTYFALTVGEYLRSGYKPPL
ncbi:MAG: hypothetical protein N3C13_05415 [Aquificaceae bacterium]|nr:hypothetical protein [Aquificaceae bacterium]